MHKVLHLLGLLRRGPMSGYDLHRIVRAHGEIYTDLKKGNVYYLLDRLAVDGYLHVEEQPGARGPRGVRLVYSLTDRGRAHFDELLREVLRSYETIHTGVDVAMVFLAQLPHAEALALLEERRQVMHERRAKVAADVQDLAARGTQGRIIADHLLTLIDAEIGWLDRALEDLRANGWGEPSDPHGRS
jgi:DNA-binding PadR family transcriptional regulator